MTLLALIVLVQGCTLREVGQTDRAQNKSIEWLLDHQGERLAPLYDTPQWR